MPGIYRRIVGPDRTFFAKTHDQFGSPVMGKATDSSPVAAARAAVATGVWELKLHFYPSAGGYNKIKKYSVGGVPTLLQRSSAPLRSPDNRKTQRNRFDVYRSPAIIQEQRRQEAGIFGVRPRLILSFYDILRGVYVK